MEKGSKNYGEYIPVNNGFEKGRKSEYSGKNFITYKVQISHKSIYLYQKDGPNLNIISVYAQEEQREKRYVCRISINYK